MSLAVLGAVSCATEDTVAHEIDTPDARYVAVTQEEGRYLIAHPDDMEPVGPRLEWLSRHSPGEPVTQEYRIKNGVGDHTTLIVAGASAYWKIAKQQKTLQGTQAR